MLDDNPTISTNNLNISDLNTSKTEFFKVDQNTRSNHILCDCNYMTFWKRQKIMERVK